MNPLISPARMIPAVRSAGILESGLTSLVSGQSYIDVVFAAALPGTSWNVLASVINTADTTPLNIWPGIVTAKSTLGFTVQLNGTPDSANYYLYWAIAPGGVMPDSTTYTLSGPSSGTVSVASTNFTVALPVGGTITGTVTVTPGDGGGGGTFSPTTVNLTTAAPSATFTYTPASAGAKTVSVTNNKGLTDPTNIVYTASVPFTPAAIAGLNLWLKADALALSDGTAVASWTDSSGNGNNATQPSAPFRPLFKTNRINALPALNFTPPNQYMAIGSIPGGITTSATVFIVQRKNASSGTLAVMSDPSAPGNTFAIYLPYSDGTVYFDLGDSTVTGRISSPWGGDYTHFFAWSFVAGGGNMAIYRNGISVVASGGHTNSFSPAGLVYFVNGDGGAGGGQDADIAEILIYNSALSTTDRQNVESFLRTKYGLP